MTKDAAERLSAIIEGEYIDLYTGKHWSKIFGRFLVYDLERIIGFSAAAGLCAELEQTHKISPGTHQSIKAAAAKYLRAL